MGKRNKSRIVVDVTPIEKKSKVAVCTQIIKPKTINQDKYFKALGSNEVVFGIGPAGSGKAQPLDSKIITPDGVRFMADINKDDYVIAVDGKKAKVLGTFPQGKKSIFCVEFSDGTYTECCNDHLWFTNSESERYKKGSVKSLDEIKNTLFYGKNKRLNHTLPMCSPVEFNSTKLPLDPYILGVLLGDGGFTATTPSFSNADDFLIQKLNTLLNDVGYELRFKSVYDYSIVASNYVSSSARAVQCVSKDKEISMYPSIKSAKKDGFSYNNIIKSCYNPNYTYSKLKNKGYTWCFSDDGYENKIKKILIDLNLWGKLSEQKFIPLIFKQSSIADRISLLQGLMDTDGDISKNGMSTVFSTSSKVLASDVVFLVNSLGGKAVVTSKIPKYTYKNEIKCGQKAYRVHISLPKEIIPVSSPVKFLRFKPRSKYPPIRKIKNIYYVGEKEAKCLLIDHPSHLYLTDFFIVTHNTLLCIYYAVQQIFLKNFEKIIITRPVVEAGEKLGFLPGDLYEKIDPYLRPIFDAFRTILGNENKFQEWMKKYIEIAPLAYMRGRSFDDSILILDESQNTTEKQLFLFLTRIGNNSKAIITADPTQIDLAHKKDSGIFEGLVALENVNGVSINYLTHEDVVRSEIVKAIVGAYAQYRNSKYKEDKIVQEVYKNE